MSVETSLNIFSVTKVGNKISYISVTYLNSNVVCSFKTPESPLCICCWFLSLLQYK